MARSSTFSQNGTPVLLVALSDTVSGAYTVTQLASIHHPVGGDENDVPFTINYLVTDSTGDSVEGSFGINVDDDTPDAVVIDTTAAAIVLDESPVAPGGDGIVSATADFSVNFAAARLRHRRCWQRDLCAGSDRFERGVRAVCAGCGGHERG